MLKQKCEISSNFVPDVKQIIRKRLVGMPLLCHYPIIVERYLLTFFALVLFCIIKPRRACAARVTVVVIIVVL